MGHRRPHGDHAARGSRRRGYAHRAAGRRSVPYPARLSNLAARQAQRGARSEDAGRPRLPARARARRRHPCRKLRTRCHSAARHRLRAAARSKPAAHLLLDHGVRARQPPFRAPRLRCTRGRAHRAALRATRLARGRHQSHGPAAGSICRARNPLGVGAGTAAPGAGIPRVALAEPRRVLRRHHRDQRGAPRARDHGPRAMGRDFPAAGRAGLRQRRVAARGEARSADVRQLDPRRARAQGSFPVRGRPLDPQLGAEPALYPHRIGRRDAERHTRSQGAERSGSFRHGPGGVAGHDALPADPRRGRPQVPRTGLGRRGRYRRHDHPGRASTGRGAL